MENHTKQTDHGETKIERRRLRLEKREQHNRALTDYLELVTEVMEIAVAIVVLIGFLLDIIPLIREMPELLSNDNDYSFHVFLEHAFNLVIGIEFVRMLVKHTPGSALEVLLFAIARHLVLGGETGPDLVLGVAAIAGIFAIRKYLYVHSFDSRADGSSFTFIGPKRDRGEGEDGANPSGKEEAPSDPEN